MLFETQQCLSKEFSIYCVQTTADRGSLKHRKWSQAEGRGCSEGQDKHKPQTSIYTRKDYLCFDS